MGAPNQLARQKRNGMNTKRQARRRTESVAFRDMPFFGDRGSGEAIGFDGVVMGSGHASVQKPRG
jgi:hypothetical protein